MWLNTSTGGSVKGEVLEHSCPTGVKDPWRREFSKYCCCIVSTSRTRGSISSFLFGRGGTFRVILEPRLDESPRKGAVVDEARVYLIDCAGFPSIGAGLIRLSLPGTEIVCSRLFLKVLAAPVNCSRYHRRVHVAVSVLSSLRVDCSASQDHRSLLRLLRGQREPADP